MRVSVDLKKCSAHGECAYVAEQVFALEDGADTVTVINPEPGEDLRAEVEEAKMACPVSAITVQD